MPPLWEQKVVLDTGHPGVIYQKWWLCCRSGGGRRNGCWLALVRGRHGFCTGHYLASAQKLSPCIL